MKTQKAVSVALFLTLSLVALAAQDAPVRTGGLYDQLTITLPDGWSVYDQTAAISGKAGPFGLVIFSAQPLTEPGSTTADAGRMAKADSGETLSFFVDRSPASKGMTCAKLSPTDIVNIEKRVDQDPVLVTPGRRLSGFFSVAQPRHTDIEVGACHGDRFEIEVHKDDPAKHWKFQVRAVSDGKVLYLFALRHRGAYYQDNLAVFEQAMSTVQFK